jgi:hypothetical protein
MIPRIVRAALVLYFFVGAGFLFGEVRKALVVGVSDYPKYTTNPIKFAHIDAIRFKEFLESDNAGRVEVKELTNEEATRDAIWDAVDSLQKEQPTPDTLFVFFSGHAELDSDTGELYLMPTGGDPKRLSATGLPASEFIRKLKAIGPTNLLIFLDACHTGAAILAKGGPNAVDSVPGSLDPLIANLNKGNTGGVMLFVSAAKDELSWEDEEYGEGLYTRFLIKGLEGEAVGVDGQKGGSVTAGELQSFLAREVPNRARALGKSPQHPVVSPDFRSTYVIALAPRSSQPSASGAKPSVKIQDISRLREADPELALMVHTGILQLTSPGLTWGADSNGIIQSFEMARLSKTGTLPASIRPESLISPVISNDGSLLVACSEPYSLVSISLKPDATVNWSPLKTASHPASRRTILDSCDISISLDRRFATARLHTIDGGSRLWLVSLGGGAPPQIGMADYESGVFLRDVLLLSKAGAVTVVAADTWTTLFTKDLGKPIGTLVADPEAGYFAALRDDGAGIYKLGDNKAPSFVGIDFNRSRAPRDCYLTGDHLYCVIGNGFWFQGFSPGDGGSGGVGCRTGNPRGFPSSSTPSAHGWELLFECAAEPETLRFIKGVTRTSQVRMTEPVLAARLLADGKVTIVGQRGGIYASDSVKYGDCCALQGVMQNDRTRIAAGNNGLTAVFHWDDRVGELTIFRADSLVMRSAFRDTRWVQQLAWSESNRVMALAGESRIRLIELTGNDYRNTREIDVDCGMPAAVNKSDLTFVCVDPETQKIQLRSVATGKIQREFDQHVGPVQQIYIDGTTVTAGGTFKGRSQTLITVWNASNGKVVSQRSCPVGGAQPDKPFSFFRRGNYFAQLDTPSRLLTRQSLTCESGNPLPIGASTLLRGAAAAERLAVWDDGATSFLTLNPWDEAESLGWNLELNVEDIALSPDGADVVVVVGGRILRIPMTKTGFLDLVKRRISREFSAQECDEFFTREGCPRLKH